MSQVPLLRPQFWIQFWGVIMQNDKRVFLRRAVVHFIKIRRIHFHQVTGTDERESMVRNCPLLFDPPRYILSRSEPDLSLRISEKIHEYVAIMLVVSSMLQLKVPASIFEDELNSYLSSTNPFSLECAFLASNLKHICSY